MNLSLTDLLFGKRLMDDPSIISKDPEAVFQFVVRVMKNNIPKLKEYSESLISDVLKELIKATVTSTQNGGDFSYKGFKNLVAEKIKLYEGSGLSELSDKLFPAGIRFDSDNPIFANRNFTPAISAFLVVAYSDNPSSTLFKSATEWLDKNSVIVQGD